MEPFSGVSGPAVPISCDPEQMFSLFFDDQVIHLIVTETNRYAAQCRGDSTWTTNEQEVKAYLGFHVLMGINHLPEIHDYWSNDERLHYAPIASRISRHRFEEITRYLHFVDNTTLPARGEDGYRRLQKIQPMISAIRERCLSNHRHAAQNSIDEAMIPFKGKQLRMHHNVHT